MAEAVDQVVNKGKGIGKLALKGTKWAAIGVASGLVLSSVFGGIALAADPTVLDVGKEAVNGFKEAFTAAAGSMGPEVASNAVPNVAPPVLDVANPIPSAYS